MESKALALGVIFKAEALDSITDNYKLSEKSKLLDLPSFEIW
ncbi:hypothetical protein QUF82_21305 [Thiotrichales bacterium HSG14]|nr:hypothetical protein [Thiotrichales bacterium HSG14]